MKNSDLNSVEINYRTNINPYDLIVGNLYNFGLGVNSLSYEYFTTIKLSDMLHRDPKFTKEEIKKIGVYYKDKVNKNTIESCSDLKIMHMGDKRNINPKLNYLFVKGTLGFHFNTNKICSYYIFYDIYNNRNIEILEIDFVNKKVQVYEANF